MIPRTIPNAFIASSLARKTEINQCKRYGMHAIYMYVIHKRIGVIVSVTGVCFCIFLHSELLAYITFKIYFVFPISPAEVAKKVCCKKDGFI